MRRAPRTLLAFITGPMLASAVLPALAQGKINLSESVELAVPVGRAWAVIRDFDQWHRWHPAVTATEITKGQGNGAGTVRVLTTRDGARIHEELLAYSDKLMSYRYRITESPLPVAQYVSTIKVVKGRGATVVVWRGSFNAAPGSSEAEARRVITGIYLAGFDGLKKKLAPPVPPKGTKPVKPGAAPVKPGDRPAPKDAPKAAPKDTTKPVPKDESKPAPKDPTKDAGQPAPKEPPKPAPAGGTKPPLKDAPTPAPKPSPVPTPAPKPSPVPAPSATTIG